MSKMQNPKNYKTNLTDWLCIHFVRLHEKDGDNTPSDPNLIKRINPAEKDPCGKLLHPVYSLAQRAKDLLPQIAGYSHDELQKTKKNLQYSALSLIFGFALLLLVGGGVANFLPITREVNLFIFLLAFAWIMFWLAFYIVFAIVSAIYPAFWQRSTWFQFLSGFVGTVFGLLAFRLFTVIDRLREKWGLKELQSATTVLPPDGQQPTLRQSPLSGECLAFFCSKKRFLASTAALLSHFYWLTFLLCLLLAMLFYLCFESYTFSVRTTILTSDADRTIVQILNILGKPGTWLGLHPPVDEQHFTQIKNPHPVRAVPRPPTENEVHAFWGRYILGLVAIWAFAPRLFLFGIAYLSYRRRSRDYRPDLAEPYFAELIRQMEAEIEADPPAHEIVETVPAEPGSKPVNVPKLLAAVQSMQGVLATLDSAEQISFASPRALVFGCLPHQAIPGDIWQSLLPDNELQQFHCLRRDDADIASWLDGHAEQVQKVVILLEWGLVLSGTMADSLENIIRKTPHAEHFAILSGGKRYRAKLKSDEHKIAALWDDYKAKFNRHSVECLEFDLDAPTDHARELVRGRLAGKDCAFQIAGKFDEALELILAAAEEDGRAVQDRTAKLHEEISKLYDKEITRFYNTLSNIRLPEDVLEKALDAAEMFHDAAGRTEEFIRAEVENGIKKALGLWYYLPRLKTAGMMALSGATLGAGAAVVGTVAAAGPWAALPFLAYAAGAGGGVGGAVAGSLPFVGNLLKDSFPTLPWKRAESMPAEADDTEIAELVRSSAAWALTLELQGLPEPELVRRLNEFSEKLGIVQHGSRQGNRLAQLSDCRAVLEGIAAELLIPERVD
ncbi:MAG: DUF2868 domain-containing protein [Planctomycetaceae bacterium]|nr:DUF2868 domain-containing protein [Planctomycetaceae bacterium]